MYNLYYRVRKINAKTLVKIFEIQIIRQRKIFFFYIRLRI